LRASRGHRTGPRLVLASASAARLATLRAAGLEPEVVVSGVDESRVPSGPPAARTLELARLKATTVARRRDDVFVLGCDSMLELGGRVHGKPVSAESARLRWRAMRGNHGVLHTGHWLVDAHGGRETGRTASTVVRFADVTDEEIAAYVATGEPLHVAGGFTLDGLSGPFVTGVEGDPHNVVGVSLPLLRELFAELGVPWHRLWTGPTGRHARH
jgi:septum formation protein